MRELWPQQRLADVLEDIIDYRGKAPPKSDSGVQLITARNVRPGSIDLSHKEFIPEAEYDSWMNRGRPSTGDILFTTEAPLGNACMYPTSGTFAVGQRIVTLRPKREIMNSQFLSSFLQSEEGQNRISFRSTGSTAKGIKASELVKILVPVPPFKRQRDIAEIFATWDHAIETCERRKQTLQRQLEGIRLKLFETAYAFDGQTRQAKDLFEPVSEKDRPDLPLLAVMQDIGVVRRDELDRRVMMPDGDINGYKVVRKGDFVISLRSFEGGLEFSRVTGLVSPAYTVLRANGDFYVSEYYRHFFKSRSFVGRLDRLIFGIRDGKQIAFRDFGDMKIPNPPTDEQEKAAEILRLVERQIKLAESEVAALKQQKRGLMQKLLIGEWRVKPGGSDG